MQCPVKWQLTHFKYLTFARLADAWCQMQSCSNARAPDTKCGLLEHVVRQRSQTVGDASPAPSRHIPAIRPLHSLSHDFSHQSPPRTACTTCPASWLLSLALLKLCSLCCLCPAPPTTMRCVTLRDPVATCKSAESGERKSADGASPTPSPKVLAFLLSADRAAAYISSNRVRLELSSPWSLLRNTSYCPRSALLQFRGLA
jgi:hypothetical protein